MLRRLFVAGAVVGFAVGLFPMHQASAANNPCTETLRNPESRYRSTWDYYHNTGSFITNVPGVGSAMNDGGISWNIVRRGNCTLVEPNWRTAFVNRGASTRTPDVADGSNVHGWVNFSSPPSNEDTTCRNLKLTNQSWAAMVCAFKNTSGIYEYGMSFNSRTPSQWTSDLNSTTHFIIQAVATHEFGHAIGLGHVPASNPPTFADGGALLTMYTTYFLGQTHNGWYTLGRGDMFGYREVQP